MKALLLSIYFYTIDNGVKENRNVYEYIMNAPMDAVHQMLNDVTNFGWLHVLDKIENMDYYWFKG
jgi:hypothetical protein